ncbi:MAG: glycosyltransferase family 2 protein [Rubricella sp.]
MPRPPISVFLITLNEEARLGRTLDAVRGWADEIVVVDSGSTDRTLEIAKAAGARVFHNDWPGYGAQKRFAEDRCSHDWLFNLDADEVPGPRLLAEIDAALGTEPALFRTRILNVYPGDDRPRPLANDYNVVRLYHRAAGRYRDHPLFDRVEPSDEAAIRKLSEPILHYPFTDWGSLAAKLNRLTDFQAREAKRKPRGVLLARLFVEFPVQFVKYWLFRGHILGGWKGFAFAVVQAFFRWLRIVKMLAADQATSAP